VNNQKIIIIAVIMDITQPAPRITGLTIAHTRVPIIAPMMIATTFATFFIWLNLRL